jgi:hypothetical protein
MKRWILTICFLSVAFGFCKYVLAFGNKQTHPALTEKSIAGSVLDNYLKTQLSMDEGVNSDLQYNVEAYNAWIKRRMEIGGVEDPGNTKRTILKWIKAGSNIEDEHGTYLPSIRPRHHFHDPIRNAGLDNKTDHPNYGSFFAWATGIYTYEFDVTGQSAKTWAIDGFAEQEPTGSAQCWAFARGTFYQALTMPNKSWREEDLAETFLDLGCVLHMIEDMGVPAHTRNDFLFAHYRPPLGFGNPLEKHVEDEIKDLGAIPERWLEGWTPQAKVFSKLAHYWDVSGYVGQYVGTSPPANWGLSERTNYQFLSQSTIFRVNNGTKYYFPHPDPCNVGPHIDSSWWYKRRYKTGYGITHLARTKFTEKYVVEKYDPNHTYGPASHWPYRTETVPYDTTFDEAVYEDYAKVTVPRTIDYATGLANYFFRGRLNVEPNWIDPNIVKLVITNESSNSGVPQTLKGGTFEIYRDDANDTRTEINPVGITFTPQWTPASTLPNDGGLTKLIAQFAPPAERVKKYIVVYKGNISENPLDPDPNDPNAIAVGILRCGYEIVAWAIDPTKGDKYGQVSNVPQGSHFIAIAAGKRHCLALRSDGSIAAWGWDKYGQCSNTPSGNDFIAIAAGNYHSIALKSDGSIVVWGDDSLWQITDKPSGNDFVAITAGDYHSLALKSDGTIVGWGGYNSYGECDAPAPDPGTVYTAISAGTYHSLALQSDGTVKAWGDNYYGQTRIYDGAAGEVHIAIAACANYSFILRDDKMLIAWGNGDWLEPDIPRYHYRYPDGTDFVAIAAGWDHILALTSAGQILSWYWPDGDFPFDYFSRTVPSGIVFTDDISAGYDFSLSLKAP